MRSVTDNFATGGLILVAIVTAVVGTITLRPPAATDPGVLPSGPGFAPSPSRTESWTTFHSAEHGFTVRYPQDWQRATDVLADRLVEPYEILSIGTYPLIAGGGDCGPGTAVEDGGSEDAFIWVIEYPDEDFHDLPSRPDDFATFHDNEDVSSECIRRFPIYGGGFSDASRNLHVYVVLGESVTQGLARTTWDVLNTLRFEDGD